MYFKESSLLVFFETSRLEITISTFGSGYTFGDPRSVAFIKKTQKYYNYVVDATNRQLVVFDTDWQFLYNVTLSVAPRFMTTAGKNLYVSTDAGIMKMDLNHNILIQTNTDNWYRRIHYNASNNLLYASNVANNSIDTFDRNLNFLNRFSIMGYEITPGSICAYKEDLFVSTKTNEILVIQNNAIAKVYSNICPSSGSSARSLFFDSYGYLAVSCTGRSLLLYHANGSYMGLSLNTNCVPNFILFDSKGSMVTCGDNLPVVDIFY